jgi:GntR family transcriptional regulator
MSMSFGADDSVPVYLQMAADLRREIAEGVVKPGERLPPARDLAAVMGVNQNTMFRALRVLRDEGILDFQRGRGITVSGNAPGLSDVVARCRELLVYSIQLGYRKEEVVRIILRLS